MSQSQTQSYDFEMPVTYASSRSGRKRSRSNSFAKVSQLVARVPRSIGTLSNTCLIPRIVIYDLAFTTDSARGFGFSNGWLYVNGAQTVAIAGFSELSALFDLVRIHKVECTLLPGNNSFDYAANTVTTGTRNIPYVYDAFDPNDSSNPSLSDIQQMATCHTHSLDKRITRTIYPNCSPSTSVVDSGVQRKNQWVKSNVDSVQYCGWKVYADLQTDVFTYDVARCSFKIFYECKGSF